MVLGEQVTDKKAVKRFQTLEAEFNNTHNFRYDYRESIYINMVTKIKIVCPDHGIFWVEPFVHAQGTVCKLCNLNNRTYSTNKFIQKAVNKYGDKFDYSKVQYIASNKAVDIICKEHGMFSIQPAAHLYGKGGCKICISLTTDEFIQKAFGKHGDKFDYSLVNYTNTKTKIDIICKEHGVFSQTPNVHLKSKYGCPKCSTLYSTMKRTTTQNEFIYRANIIHNNLYDYTCVDYTKCGENINIICNTHGLFSQEANSHLQGHGCPRCASQKTLYLSNYTKYKNKKTTLYYIKISESYWKLGLTKQSVEKRFRKELANGLKIEILFTEEFEDGWDAYLIEQDALLESIEYRIQKYDSPISGGWTEIRNIDFINKIKIKDKRDTKIICK